MSIPAITAFRSRPDTSPSARSHLSNLRFGSRIDAMLKQIETSQKPKIEVKNQEETEFKKLCDQVIKFAFRKNKSLRCVDFLLHMHEKGPQNVFQLIEKLRLTKKKSKISLKFIEEMTEKNYIMSNRLNTLWEVSPEGRDLLKKVYPYDIRLSEKGYSPNEIFGLRGPKPI